MDSNIDEAGNSIKQCVADRGKGDLEASLKRLSTPVKKSAV